MDSINHLGPNLYKQWFCFLLQRNEQSSRAPMGTLVLLWCYGEHRIQAGACGWVCLPTSSKIARVSLSLFHSIASTVSRIVPKEDTAIQGVRWPCWNNVPLSLDQAHLDPEQGVMTTRTQANAGQNDIKSNSHICDDQKTYWKQLCAVPHDSSGIVW